MKTGLRLSALAVCFVALALWLFGGAHRGFSKTSVMTTVIDPVTGLEAHPWEQRLVLGVDFLAVAAAVAALLFGASWLFGKRSNRNHIPTQPT